MTIRLYWWSPAKVPIDLVRELRYNSRAWASLALRTGRTLTNMGDALGANIVSSLTGQRVSWARLESAELVSIGSVLELAIARRQHEPLKVWGSGLRQPSQFSNTGTFNNHEVLAVRGSLTHRALGLHESIPLGDPGLLASEVFPYAPRRAGRRVVIPHFGDFNSRSRVQSLRAARTAGLDIIHPTLSAAEVYKRIQGAEVVYASAMHGLILADSAGVPAYPVTSGGIVARPEPHEKFDDYHSSLGLPPFAPLVLQEAMRRTASDAVHNRAARVADRLHRVQAGLAAALTRAF